MTFRGLRLPRLLLGLVLLPAAVRATTVVPPEFELLVNESDYVVRAVVESVRAEYRDGPQGRLIWTLVGLRVTEKVAGQPPDRLELAMAGGEIGNDRLVLVGAPTFRVGDEDFLFVRDNGRTIHPLFALMYGRYPVLRDAATGAAYVARSNRVPLQDVAEVALPLAEGPAAALQQRAVRTGDALTPAAFARQIQAKVDPHHVRRQAR
jgi:hypothetical protein